MRDFSVRDMVVCSLFAVMIAVSSYISIPVPFSPVPISLQTLMIMIIGLVLEPKKAFYSVFLWIGLGAFGLPVFSGGKAGVMTLVSPTGGYIIGFLLGALIISLIKGNAPNINIFRMFFATVIGGILVVYLIGVPYLAFILKMDIMTAIKVGAIPFLIGDFIKAFFAVNLAKVIRATNII